MNNYYGDAKLYYAHINNNSWNNQQFTIQTIEEIYNANF